MALVSWFTSSRLLAALDCFHASCSRHQAQTSSGLIPLLPLGPEGAAELDGTVGWADSAAFASSETCAAGRDLAAAGSDGPCASAAGLLAEPDRAAARISAVDSFPPRGGEEPAGCAGLEAPFAFGAWPAA